MRDCKRCGAPITTRGQRIRFCSPKCWYASMDRPRVKRACEVCGKEMILLPHLKVRTCSKECGGKLRRKGTALKCISCGKDFWKYPSQPRKFCSLRCATTWNKKQVPVTCRGCGKEFTRGRALVKRVKNRYCSRECFNSMHHGELTGAWRGGNNHYRGHDWPQKSALARARDGYKCQVCGTSQPKTEKLSVDHIIPYRLVKCNELVNLLSVCRAPCHNVKTQGAERAFLKGDYLTFIQKLNQAGWPMRKVEDALQWWGTLAA